ncbi:MAG: hypothetical protein IH587_10320 [Anaerolineae bacterium]|nr:hypothetical protein [Anaerolineae bacterium]
MTVTYCHICNNEPQEKRSYGDEGLDQGDYCPVCHRPACRFHLGTVRWRWRNTGKLDSARVCMSCKNSYSHRDWDPVHRDWIS